MTRLLESLLFIAITGHALLLAGVARADGTQLKAAIVSPADGSEVSGDEIVVRLAIDLPEGETISMVKVYIDGRLAAQARGLKLIAPAVESTSHPDRALPFLITVPIPAHDSTLGVLVDGKQHKSALVTARLRWQQKPRQADPKEALPPKLYVLAVGISNYKQPDIRLRFAAKDARDFSAVFAAQKKRLYRDVEIKTLVDEKATRDNILDGLEWLQRQTTARDVAVLFMAGHGITDAATGAYYFLPHDADTDAVKRTMVPEAEVRNTLASIPGKVLLFLDTCHSGKVYARTQLRGPEDLTTLIQELSSAENGVVVFAASASRQSSQEASEWGNGAFTKAVVEGLRGRADNKKSGHVTLSMLELYVSDRVKELTGGRQTPTTAKPTTIPDFPIAVSREFGNDDVEVAR